MLDAKPQAFNVSLKGIFDRNVREEMQHCRYISYIPYF